MQQESRDHIQKTLQPFLASPTDLTSSRPVETIQGTHIQVSGERGQDVTITHLPPQSKGQNRGRGQSTVCCMVAPSATCKGKGQGTTTPSSNEGPKVGSHILSEDKFPMTDEYLAMCQEVWQCMKKYTQEAYPHMQMGVIIGLFQVKQ
jgi:hypothetical protein